MWNSCAWLFCGLEWITFLGLLSYNTFHVICYSWSTRIHFKTSRLNPAYTNVKGNGH